MAKKKKSLFILVLIGITAVMLGMKFFIPVKVKVVKAEKRDLVSEVYGNGTVEAKVMVGISSKITGRIVELYADQGDTVRQGQLLAKLENTDFAEQQKKSEAELKRMAAGIRIEQANLGKARANLNLAEKNRDRFRNLAEKNLVSRLEAEQYENAYQIAKEEAARSAASCASAQSEQDAGRAEREFSRSRLSDTLIYAPQNGIIIVRNLEKGATVTPGMPIFSLADPTTVWVKANVDESLLKGIAIGKKARISLRSSPDETLPGHVARISAESDRVTEELEVDVAFTPPLEHFRLGEQSDVYIIVESKKSTMSLPTAAIVTKEKKKGVWVVEQKRLVFRPVTTGIEDRRNFIEIITGLDGSEKIAMSPLPDMARLREGMRVKAL